MSHNHHHHHETENIRTAFFLNLFFTLIEIIGGIFTNSVAILSDALHDLGDSISLGLSWYFQKLSQKKRDQQFTFGYRRFSIFGAIINSIILVIGSIIIIWESFPRLFNPQQPNAEGMILLSIFGIIVNGAAVLKLKKGSSLNEKVVSLHLMEDVLGWVAVLIASIVMTFYSIPILDPMLSLLIAAYILFNVYKNLKNALKIILQASPSDIDVASIEKKISGFKEIDNVHDIHLWTMDGEYNVLTIHVALHENKDLDQMAELKTKIRDELNDKHIQHITIEFESKDEHCVHLDC
ncbi:MAG: cation transporter [Calditrichaeota bacterium]|nr:MAG: cation transporter [Calditrichota bacterium]MBL1206862.1 cation transporter [Calditrichota bacterium]NOG46689.1 cation transporter [Calditrichota bacterium]